MATVLEEDINLQNDYPVQKGAGNPGQHRAQGWGHSGQDTSLYIYRADIGNGHSTAAYLDTFISLDYERN